MSLFTERASKKIDMVFVLALITLFAATSFTLVLIGTKQYRSVTNTMSENHEGRIISSYLSEKICQHDAENAITIADLKGTPALSLASTENDMTYITYIYYYEGALRELVVTDSSVFSLSSGQEIVEMQGFRPEFTNDSLIRAEVIDTAGEKQVLYFYLHSSTGKEAS